MAQETYILLTKDDTDAIVRARFKNAGAALDLTSYAAVKLFVKPDGGVILTAIVGTVVDAVAGLADFDCTSVAAVAGDYRAQFETTNASGKRRRSREDYVFRVKKKVEDWT